MLLTCSWRNSAVLTQWSRTSEAVSSTVLSGPRDPQIVSKEDAFKRAVVSPNILVSILFWTHIIDSFCYSSYFSGQLVFVRWVCTGSLIVNKVISCQACSVILSFVCFITWFLSCLNVYIIDKDCLTVSSLSLMGLSDACCGHPAYSCTTLQPAYITASLILSSEEAFEWTWPLVQDHLQSRMALITKINSQNFLFFKNKENYLHPGWYGKQFSPCPLCKLWKWAHAGSQKNLLRLLFLIGTKG